MEEGAKGDRSVPTWGPGTISGSHDRKRMGVEADVRIQLGDTEQNCRRR